MDFITSILGKGGDGHAEGDNLPGPELIHRRRHHLVRLTLFFLLYIKIYIKIYRKKTV
jgi:hypothetical protein